ncbi:MarR family winged helix-turn-helix transcriptional regulator [Eilatimonas milleporae]|uniref:DNA-binding MarR family transcriptional regulator n=1 Tax=Eilatimonas milleporae TaxID=911205 RepID=A0A3M0CI82_9PROT|nr:MarR family winged helix-turn-helix transcriptional regulator [Eilatimonas milleporae]RMB08467.1 DNA-binding MarR family transcriptional regulator [Eilatimonas milleporae]
MADHDMNDRHAALTLASFLPYRLSVLSNRVSRAIADRYEARFQISLPEWRVMAVLGDTPDLSAADVAERTAMDKVAVSRAVARLLQSGRLIRHFAADDRRRSVLSLSAEGYAVYRRIVPLALAYEQEILAKLSMDERETLDRLLDKLAAPDAVDHMEKEK